MRSIQTTAQTLFIIALTALFGLYGCADQLADDAGNDDVSGPQESGNFDGTGESADNRNPDNSAGNSDVGNGGSNDGPEGDVRVDENGDGNQMGQAETDGPDGNSGEEMREVPGGETDNHVCALDGVAAVKIVAQVSWPGSLAMEAGRGTFEIWFKADISDDGTSVTASGHVCEVSVPDFHTNALAGGDTHGTVIPSEAWVNSPRTMLSLVLSGREAGSTLRVDPTPMFLGTELDNPMGEWPNSSASMRPVDHDNDGYPGVTSYAAMGAGYSNPRIAIINPNLRANRIFLGMRNIIGFDGMLTACDRAEGAADLSLDQRSFGCLTPDGTACNDQQTGLLDSNMPQFQVEQASFTLQKLPGAASCGDIRATLP